MAILVQSNKKPSVSYPSQTGSIVTFNSQYAGLPLKSHKVAVTATQSGSGTPSLDNVRPISGHDVITISHSGADTSTPTTYTVTIGSTVYCGEYDAITGLLLVTHELVTYNSNNVPYMQIGTISGGVKTRVFIRQSGVSQTVSGVPDMLCNIANPVEVNAQYQSNEGISIRVNANVNNQGFYIYNEDIQTLTEWQDYINNNSITVVYPLATPMTIQLPPCPIDTLQGENNLFASTGDTTVSHIKIGG